MLTHERFAYLAEKYIDTVFRVAFSYLKSREDADDVTQEVFIKVYSVNTEFESEDHIRNWLNGGERGHARRAGEHGKYAACTRKGKAENGTDGGGT